MNYLGCSGWYYEHWVGPFYPKDLPKNQWLQYYCKHFNSVEVNASFYRFPTKNMVKGWYDKTPDDFKVTLKAKRYITHIKKLSGVKRIVNGYDNFPAHLASLSYDFELFKNPSI